MKIAILARKDCRIAVETIEHMTARNLPVDLVVIETDVRKKLSKNELRFKQTHTQFREYLQSQTQGARKLFFFLDVLSRRLPPETRMKLRQVVERVFLRRSSSVESRAKAAGCRVAEVARHSSEETRALFEEHDIDYAILGCSAWLIKEPLFSLPKLKIVNAHVAKLPPHRALDSLPWSVLHGSEVGITTHYVDSGIDTGDTLLFVEVPLRAGDDLVRLRARVDSTIPEAFYRTLAGLADGTVEPSPQEEEDGIHHQPMTLEEMIDAENALQERLAGC